MIFLEIIKKNFRVLMRSKKTALTVFFGPLILMLLISLAFNSSSLYDIKIGVYSSSYSELSSSIIEKLEDDAFKVIKIEDEESCINSMKEGSIHVCAIFPPNLDVNSKGNIIFYVDKSRMNLVYSIMGSISSKISSKSTELSTILTTKLINALQKTEQIVSEKGENIITLKTSLINTKNNIAKVESNLNAIEITNISLLKEEMNNVKEKVNTSNSVFNDLENIIEAVSGDVGTALDLTNSSITKTKQIRSDLNAQVETANKLKEAIDSIKEEVDNIKIKDVQRIVTPVNTEIKPLTSEGTHLTYSVPTLLMLVLLFAGIFLASTTVIEEKKSKAYFRNFITPTKNFTYIISNYLFCLLILAFQTAIIIGVMSAITKTTIPTTMLPNLILGLLLISSIFILLGMAIGYALKDEETANIGSISIAIILLFFSNTILPIESLPAAIRKIVNLNPLVIGESVIRRIYLFNEPISHIPVLVYFLLAYIIVLTIITFLTRKLAKTQIE